MKEDFLHHVWKYKLFSLSNLTTSNNLSVIIEKVGVYNLNAGPDFFNAQIAIDHQKWAGNVELHVKSSDWYVHGHEKDSNYDTIILHVVWEDDVPIYRKDNSLIPTLELKHLVNPNILNSYRSLFSKEPRWINCQNDIAKVDQFLLNNWLERLYFERLEQKTSVILELLKKSNNDWEAVLFQLLAKNFGLKVNGEAFLSMANSFEFSVLRKEWNSQINLEALFFGQAKLLDKEIEDEYYKTLQTEYNYLTKKHQLKAPESSKIQFFRLRPNNFPTIRLSHLASLYVTNQNLFSRLIDIKGIEGYYNLFSVAASTYWNTHYSFESSSKKRVKRLSKSFIDLLLINTVIPLKFVYLKHIGKLDQEHILQLIREIHPEKNAIVEKFAQLGVKSNSSFKTQSLLQLKNEYCNKLKCLECNIGNKLLTN